MKNLWLLTKINLLTFFDFNKLKKVNDKKEFFMMIGKVLLILFIFLSLIWSLYIVLDETMPIYVSLGHPYITLVQYFAISSVIILFTNIFKINGILFKFKDYDLLMSMPISRKTIISSRLILLYITNIFYVLLFMLPAYLCYIAYINVDFVFHLLFFITLFIIPLVPIIIATILGSLLTMLSSKFRFKNIMNMILSILLVVIVMYFSFSLENYNSLDLANLGESMVKIFNQFYPLTRLYFNIMKNYNILSLLLFILIPIGLFFVYLWFINCFYEKINDNLNKTYTKGDYRISKTNTKTPLLSLYNKELKRYFSSYNYVLNTGIGALMLTLVVFVVVVFGNEQVETFLQIPGFSEVFNRYLPLVLGGFCMMCCSTHSAISLEGKNIWIIKSLPVSVMKIFISKIMVNMTILIPTIIINATALAIYLKVSLITYLFMLLTPVVYSIFISFLGLFYNLLFPLLNYDNEIRVIKQSLSVFLSTFSGLAVAIVPFVIEVSISDNLYILLVTIIISILNVILYFLLKTVGEKRFINL